MKENVRLKPSERPPQSDSFLVRFLRCFVLEARIRKNGQYVTFIVSICPLRLHVLVSFLYKCVTSHNIIVSNHRHVVEEMKVV